MTERDNKSDGSMAIVIAVVVVLLLAVPCLIGGLVAAGIVFFRVQARPAPPAVQVESGETAAPVAAPEQPAKQ
jgi:hypothetical protein